MGLGSLLVVKLPNLVNDPSWQRNQWTHQQIGDRDHVADSCHHAHDYARDRAHGYARNFYYVDVVVVGWD